MNKIHLKDFDAVAFDVDGTLADTIPIHHATRLEAFKRHGYGHITAAQHALGPTYGSTVSDIVGGILYAGGAIEKTESFRDHPTVLAVMQSKSKLYDERARQGFDEQPGATDFVKEICGLFAGKVALVTASPLKWVAPFVVRYGLDGVIPGELVIDEEEILRLHLEPKPAPDAYELAKARLSSQRLLVFEDTVPGVESAKRAGATVIALGFEEHNTALFKDAAYPPDAIAMDYAEVRQLLGL